MREVVEVPSEPDDGVAALAQQAWQMEIAGKLSLGRELCGAPLPRPAPPRGRAALAIAVKVLWTAFQKKADEARQDVHAMFQSAIKALTELREEFTRVSTHLAVIAERQQSAEGRTSQVEKTVVGLETTVVGLKERVLVLEHTAAASSSGVRKRTG